MRADTVPAAGTAERAAARTSTAPTAAWRAVRLGLAIGSSAGLLATFVTYVHVLALSRAHRQGMSFLGAYITPEERAAYYIGATVVAVVGTALAWRAIASLVRQPLRGGRLALMLGIAAVSATLSWSAALHTTYLAVETVTNGPFDDGPELEL